MTQFNYKVSKVLIHKKFLGFFTLCLCSHALAGPILSYKELTLKDLDQMNKLMHEKMRSYKREDGSPDMQGLKEALRLVLSRPDNDNMIDKLLPEVRRELEETQAWDRALSELTDEALQALQNVKENSADTQATYLIFLENILSEFKPELKETGPTMDLFKKIKDAKIRMSEAVTKERYRNIMKTTGSPSELAEKILKHYQEKSAKIPKK